MPNSYALLWFYMFPLEAIFGLAERYPVRWDAPSGNYFWQRDLREVYAQDLSLSAGGHRPTLNRSLSGVEGSPDHRFRSSITGGRSVERFTSIGSHSQSLAQAFFDRLIWHFI